MAFGTQSLRLLREKWPDANMLAEELYAIFQAVDKQVVEAQPAQDVTSAVQGVTPMTINPFPGDSSLIQFGPNGSIGSINLVNGAIQIAGPNGQPQSSGGGDMGQIVSGSGASYTIQLLSNGQKVPAQVKQIASSEQIPVGTWLPVVIIGIQNGTTVVQTYFIQPAVWL